MHRAIFQFGVPFQVAQMSKVFAELENLPHAFQPDKRDPDKIITNGKSSLKQLRPFVSNW